MQKDNDRLYKELEEKLEQYQTTEKDKEIKRKSKIIDLHGLNRMDAENKINGVLKTYRTENITELKIICGKGIHSEFEPVLFEHINNFLKTKKNYYSKIKTDKNNNIYIFLRR